MPSFLTESDYAALRDNPEALVAKAEDHIRSLEFRLEKEKAQAETVRITSEGTCSLLEQKYLALASEHNGLEEEKKQLKEALDERAAELAHVKSQAHQMQLEAIKKENELEVCRVEISEQKATRNKLLEIITQRDADVQEKNAAIKSYLDKIVRLTDDRAILEGKVREAESEQVRLQSINGRLQQEKELLKEHSDWLNRELTMKSQSSLEERRAAANREAELSAKLDAVEKAEKDASASTKRLEERCKELENSVSRLQERLKDAKDTYASQEANFEEELEAGKRLAKLYEESSEEWKKKYTELRGVVASLKEHLSKEKANHEEALAKEVAAREAAKKKLAEAVADLEKQLAEAKEQIIEVPQRQLRGGVSAAALAVSAPQAAALLSGEIKFMGVDFKEEEPAHRRLALELSPTALAAALIQEGMTLTEMYARYAEAADAYRHEKHARKRLEADLQQVYFEIERRAPALLEERDRFLNMEKAYANILNQTKEASVKLKEQERAFIQLQADLRRSEREKAAVESELSEMQREVAFLVMECQEYQKSGAKGLGTTGSEAEKVSFRSYEELVANYNNLKIDNANLRAAVEQQRETLKGAMEVEKAEMVETYTRQVERMTDVLHSNEARMQQLERQLAMYQSLWEDARPRAAAAPALEGRLDSEANQTQEYRALHEKAKADLEEIRARLEDEKKALQAKLDEARTKAVDADVKWKHAESTLEVERERSKSLTEAAQIQSKEMEGLRSRNLEFAMQVTEHQRRLREAEQARADAQDRCRRLEVQVDCVEKEKSLLVSAEARASEEARTLSQNVHQLQARLDAAHASQQAVQESSAAERQRLLEDYKRLQHEWADGQQAQQALRGRLQLLEAEAEQERAQVRERLETASKNVEEARVAAAKAEGREKAAQARVEQLEKDLKKADEKIALVITGGKGSKGAEGGEQVEDREDELLAQLLKARGELDATKEDLEAAKKNVEEFKRIAHLNEDALNKIGEAYEQYRTEVKRGQEAAEAEGLALRQRIEAVEGELKEKREALEQAAKEKEQALQEVAKQQGTVKEDFIKAKRSLEAAEAQNAVLKADVERHQKLYRDAQHNYERQVLLLADNIKQLEQLSDKLTRAEAAAQEGQSRAEAAEQLKVTAEVAWAAEKSALAAARDEAEGRQMELENQNRKLLDRLESIQSPPPPQRLGGSEGAEGQAESEMDEVVRFLRREKDTADAKLQSALLEKDRWKSQAEHAGKAAEEARAQLALVQQKARGSLQSAEEQQALLSQLNQLNLLRESNTILRQENEQNLQQAKEWRDRVSAAEGEMEQLGEKLKDKEADLEAARKEVEHRKEDVERWRKRCEQVTKKYDSVDMNEGQRLKEQVAALEETARAEGSARKTAESAAEGARKEAEEAAKLVEAAEAARKQLEEQLEAKTKEFENLHSNHQRNLATARRIIKDNEALKKRVASLEAAGKAPAVVAKEVGEAPMANGELEQRLKQAQEAEKTARAELDKVKAETEALRKDLENGKKRSEALQQKALKHAKEAGERWLASKNLANQRKTEADLLRSERDKLKERVAVLESKGAVQVPPAAEAPAAEAPLQPAEAPKTQPAVDKVLPSTAPAIIPSAPAALATVGSTTSAAMDTTAQPLTTPVPAPMVAPPAEATPAPALVVPPAAEAPKEEKAAKPSASQMTEVREGTEGAEASVPKVATTTNRAAGRGRGAGRAKREGSVTSAPAQTPEEAREILMRHMAERDKKLKEDAEKQAKAAAAAAMAPRPPSVPVAAAPPTKPVTPPLAAPTQAVTPPQRPAKRVLKRPNLVEQEAGEVPPSESPTRAPPRPPGNGGTGKRPLSAEAPAAKRLRPEAEAFVPPPVQTGGNLEPVKEETAAEGMEEAPAEEVPQANEEAAAGEAEAPGMEAAASRERPEEEAGEGPALKRARAEPEQTEEPLQKEAENLEGLEEAGEEAEEGEIMEVEEGEASEPVEQEATKEALQEEVQVVTQVVTQEVIEEAPAEVCEAVEEATLQAEEGPEGELAPDEELEGEAAVEAAVQGGEAEIPTEAPAEEELTAEDAMQQEIDEVFGRLEEMDAVQGDEDTRLELPEELLTLEEGDQPGEETKEEKVDKDNAAETAEKPAEDTTAQTIDAEKGPPAPPGGKEDEAADKEPEEAAKVELEPLAAAEEAAPAEGKEQAAGADTKQLQKSPSKKGRQQPIEGPPEPRRTRSTAVSTAKAFAAAKAKASALEGAAKEALPAEEEPKAGRLINLGERPSRKGPMQRMLAEALQPEALRTRGGRGRGARGGRGASMSPRGRGRRAATSAEGTAQENQLTNEEPTSTANKFDALRDVDD